MTRSLSNAKIFSSSVVEGVSAAITRRGLSATSAPQGVAKTGATISAMAVARKTGEEAGESRVSWIPDPKTGFYRPESHAEDIDVAELRAMLLKHKN